MKALLKIFFRIMLYLVVIAAVLALGLVVAAEVTGFASVWELLEYIRALLWGTV